MMDHNELHCARKIGFCSLLAVLRPLDGGFVGYDKAQRDIQAFLAVCRAWDEEVGFEWKKASDERPNQVRTTVGLEVLCYRSV